MLTARTWSVDLARGRPDLRDGVGGHHRHAVRPLRDDCGGVALGGLAPKWMLVLIHGTAVLFCSEP